MKVSSLASLGFVLTVMILVHPGVALSADLVGYWPFRGDATDESGFANHGTVDGASLTTDRCGNANSAFSFDGDDFINLGDSNILKPALPISITAWIRLSDVADWSAVFMNDSGHLFSGVWMLITPGGGIGIYYGSNGEIGPAYRNTKYNTNPLQVGIWYHVAGVIRGYNDMDIYVNATNDGGSYQGSYSGPVVYSSMLLDAMIGRFSLVDTHWFMRGDIDDVRLYSEALSAQAVSSIFAASCSQEVSVIAGPFVRRATGHTYYLLEPRPWSDSEAKAQSLGGHLVTINDQAENGWVFDTFKDLALLAEVTDCPCFWIGYSDAQQEGVWRWASGETPGFQRWSPGEPSNHTPDDDYAHMWGSGHTNPGTWNDLMGNGVGYGGDPVFPYGIVEVPTPKVPSISQPGLLFLAAGVLLAGSCGIAYSRRERGCLAAPRRRRCGRGLRSL